MVFKGRWVISCHRVTFSLLFLSFWKITSDFFFFMRNLSPPSVWDFCCFKLPMKFWLISVMLDAQKDDWHSHTARLMQEPHPLFKVLHSCFVRNCTGDGRVLPPHTHHGLAVTFNKTAVINQQLMILMADMRGTAELFLLITFSDSPVRAHARTRVCVCVW